MTNGALYWDYQQTYTGRRIKSIIKSSSTLATINFEISSKLYSYPSMGLVKGTGTNSFIKIKNLENDQSWANDYWRVAGTVTSSSAVCTPASSQNLSGNSSITNAQLAGYALKVSNTSGSDISPNERIKLSAISWNSKSDTMTPYILCGKQNSVMDMLNQFWGDPVIKREYKFKKQQYGSTWINDINKHPNISGDNTTAMTELWMCVGRGEATNCGCWDRYSNNSNNYYGIWQINPTNFNGSPWNITDNTVYYDWNVCTRAALWLMTERLFKQNWDTDVKHSPFFPWSAARTDNAKFSACMSNNPSAAHRFYTSSNYAPYADTSTTKKPCCPGPCP